MSILYALAALAILVIVALPVITHRADKRAGLIKDRINLADKHHTNAMEWRLHNSRRVYPTNEDMDNE